MLVSRRKVLYTFRCIFVLFITLLFVVVNSVTGFAIDSPLVELTVKNKKVHEKIFTASVDIQFDDITIYDDTTAISYHVYDAGGNLIAWDYPRTGFSLDTNNSATVDVPIDLSGILDGELTIQFDMVVEGQYWYSQRTDLYTKLDSIQYEPYTIFTYIASNFFLFAINAICFVFAIVVIIIIKQKRLLTFKNRGKVV